MLFERSYQFLGGGTTGGPQQKKGLARIWELVMDNLARFLVCGLITLFFAIPCALGILYALSRNDPMLLAVAGLAGGVIFGPAYAALTDGVLLAVRDRPGNWWRRYLHAWRANWRDALLPGAILGGGVSVLTYEYMLLRFEETLPLSLWAPTAVAILFFALMFTYLWPQLVYTDLKFHQMFSNSLLMLLAHPLVSLAAALVQLVYWGLLLWFFPFTAVIIPLTGVWLPNLLGIFVIFGQFSREFKIDQPDQPDQPGQTDGEI